MRRTRPASLVVVELLLLQRLLAAQVDAIIVVEAEGLCGETPIRIEVERN